MAPRVSVWLRSDLLHNGSRTVNVSGGVFNVRPYEPGTVFDVRSYELVRTLSVHGTSATLALSVTATPVVEAASTTSKALAKQLPHPKTDSLAEDGDVRTFAVTEFPTARRRTRRR